MSLSSPPDVNSYGWAKLPEEENTGPLKPPAPPRLWNVEIYLDPRSKVHGTPNVKYQNVSVAILDGNGQSSGIVRIGLGEEVILYFPNNVISMTLTPTDE